MNLISSLTALDWFLLVGCLLVTLVLGILPALRPVRSTSGYFLAGRHMPWWLLGVSMVATTFSADTPNFVTNVVRTQGVAGNWMWWSFLLTGMLTVFVYARLWRRSGLTSDIGFYELRYGGRTAALLRGFRALYLGLFFNTIVMANVILAAIKIGGLMGMDSLLVVGVCGVVTVTFSAVGGLASVVLTDFFLFGLAIVGSFAVAVAALEHSEVDGLTGLLTHPQVADKLALVPQVYDSSGHLAEGFVTAMLIPLTVQWWSVWYPGSEPGGGGYMAQRMLSARNETDAVRATLLFNAAHYALRPWPWIIVALASLVVFPDHASLQHAFPHMDSQRISDDLAYPAMISFVPSGWKGVVLASLAAAFISTISTHLNWGSSYVVEDFYRRFVEPAASQHKLVWVGRAATVLMMAMAGALALVLRDALQGFQLLLQVGAGTGLVFILRWYWWRISAISEIVAMIVSFTMAVLVASADRLGWDELADWQPWQHMLLGVGATTVAWLIPTLCGPSERQEVLERFVERMNPGGPGWRRIVLDARQRGEPLEPRSNPVHLPSALACMTLGSLSIYGALLGTGLALYGNIGWAAVLFSCAIFWTIALALIWRRNQP